MATLRYTCACTRYLSPTRVGPVTKPYPHRDTGHLLQVHSQSAPTSPARWRSTTTNSTIRDDAATEAEQPQAVTANPEQSLAADDAAKKSSFRFKFSSLSEGIRDVRDWTAVNAPKMDPKAIAKLVSSLNLDLPRYRRMLKRSSVSTTPQETIERLKREQLEEKRARLRKKLDSEDAERETHDFTTAMLDTHDCIQNYYSSINVNTPATTQLGTTKAAVLHTAHAGATEITQASILNQVLPKGNNVENTDSTKTPEASVTDQEAVARAAVNRRTRGLVAALKEAKTEGSRLHRLEDLCLHLSQYIKFAKNVAIKEKIIPYLLKLRNSSEPAMAEHALQALHLVGYVEPVKGQGIRILTIDGGGTRGLIAIEMMRQIENATGKPIHEMFDYICGVSTGALIAVMVGVFRRPLDECEQLYKEFSREMFDRSRLMGASKLLTSHAYYDTQLWEKILKENIGYDSFIDTMKDERCLKLSVVSSLVNQTNMENYLFRNYTHTTGVQSKYKGSTKHSLWEAIRASSAAPGYYEEYKTGANIHQDGGLLTNNPGAVAIHECKLLWPNEDIQCVISVGTGRYHPTNAPQPSYSLKDKILKVVQSATDTEAVHTILHDLLPPSTYFRFNPYLSDEFLLDEINEGRWELMHQDAQMYCRRNEAKLKMAAKQLLQEKKMHQKATDWVKTTAERFS